MENKLEVFENACFKRANYIWWHSRTALLPSDAINAIATDDKEYMKLMDEREAVLQASFYATVELHQMAKEFSPKNTQEQLEAACSDVRGVYENVIKDAQVLEEKFRKLEDKYHEKLKKKK